MKPVSTFVIALALSFSAAAVLPALAQSDPAGGQPTQGGGYGGAAGERPNMRDMTLEQFQARQVSNLMQADTDHDGRISLSEWTAWQADHPGRGGRGGGWGGRGRDGGRGDPAQSFARYDLNRDGYITPDEITSVAAARYARMQGGGRGMGPDGGGSPPPIPQ